MSFEVIDNVFQVTVLLIASVVSLWLAVRHGEKRFLILSLAYACFSMETLYFVLYLAIFGKVPQVFYVAEISWWASYLFYLSLQIVRSEKIPVRASAVPVIVCMVVVIAVFVFRIFGPAWLMIGLFVATVGAITYISLFRLGRPESRTPLDALLFFCICLQISLYGISMFYSDYTRFNFYFLVDITLTLSFVGLLPLLFYFAIFEPQPKELPGIAIAIAVGFATFENVCYLAENGAENLTFLLIRGISAGALHILCGILAGFGISYVFRRKWLALTGTAGILGACVGFHAIYNLLITTEGTVRMVGYLFPSLLILCLYLCRKVLPVFRRGQMWE